MLPTQIGEDPVDEELVVEEVLPAFFSISVNVFVVVVVLSIMDWTCCLLGGLPALLIVRLRGSSVLIHLWAARHERA